MYGANLYNKKTCYWNHFIQIRLRSDICKVHSCNSYHIELSGVFLANMLFDDRNSATLVLFLFLRNKSNLYRP